MFIGREDELNALDALWGRDSGVLVTCRGRRRIGKSTLIEEFAARTSDRFIAIEGLPPRKGVSDADQRRHFCEMVAEYAGRDYIPAATWSIAFAQLNEIIPNDARTVVLLDEISWLGDHCPDFPGYLKAAWDKRLRKHPNLIMVLCGSVSTWIAENILDSTGFVGRDSLDLEIKELSLSDSVKMLGPSAERLSSRELLDMFSITGGVPKYLHAGSGSVPPRRRFSCSPPICLGRMRTPLRTYRAPQPFGAWTLCALTVSRSAPSFFTLKSSLPNAWTASV